MSGADRSRVDGAGGNDRAEGGQPGGDGRYETANQRMDRNWNELLQELRVTQTGTQVLTGFLLAVAFQPAFAELRPHQLAVYLTLVGVAVVTTAIALTPVILHRVLFRQGLKQTVVQWGHTFLVAALLGVSLVLVGTVVLIFDVALGPPWPVVTGTTMAGLVVLCFAAVPWILRRCATRQ